MGVATHIFRRGFEVAMGDQDGPKQNMPAWGAALLAVTLLVFFGIEFTVSLLDIPSWKRTNHQQITYTFGRILPTLLVIESPQEAIGFEPLATEDPDSTINKDPEQPARPGYLTSSFRRTIKHLKAVGGVRGCFRGFAIFAMNGVLVAWLSMMLLSIPFVPAGVSGVIATVICAQFPLAWTHIVISEPSPRNWFRRFPSPKLWMKVAIPTAVLAIAEQINALVLLKLVGIAGLNRDAKTMAQLSPHEQAMMSLAGFGIVAVSVVLSFLLVLPADVTLTRVQASLLPDAEETIVPFDRSFGGKVIPEIVGGSGVLSMLDAWKSFDWSSRIRLVKAYAKIYALQILVSFFFGLCLAAEMFLIAGKDWASVLPGDGNKDL